MLGRAVSIGSACMTGSCAFNLTDARQEALVRGNLEFYCPGRTCRARIMPAIADNAPFRRAILALYFPNFRQRGRWWYWLLLIDKESVAGLAETSLRVARNPPGPDAQL